MKVIVCLPFSPKFPNYPVFCCLGEVLVTGGCLIGLLYDIFFRNFFIVVIWQMQDHRTKLMIMKMIRNQCPFLGCYMVSQPWGRGGGGAPTKLFNMGSFVLLFVVVLWWPLGKLSSNIYLCEEALGLKIVLVQIISVNGHYIIVFLRRTNGETISPATYNNFRRWNAIVSIGTLCLSTQ